MKGAILIVDDELAVRSLLQVAVQRSGRQAYCATNGQEAWALYEKLGSAIGTVLLDVHLEGGEHAALLQQQQPPVRVIFMSGMPQESVAGVRLERGVNFLAKPFSMADLNSLLSSSPAHAAESSAAGSPQVRA